MYQAGTMAGNPLSISAGMACIQQLSAPGTYERLDQMGKTLSEEILRLADKYGITITINRVGGAFTVYFTDRPVENYDGAQAADGELFGQFFRHMLNEGVYLAPSKYEAWFLTTAHSEEDIQFTVRAVERSFKKMKPTR
jgi:glutamate-1-semialdehyde 2,1-aminomutase